MITPVPIENSFQKLDKYPTVIERYFTRYEFTPAHACKDESHSILVHSNRICLVTLSETHPIIRDKKTITKIDFKVTDKVDRRDNKVSGKGKKGAQLLQQDSSLCFVECSDNSRYVVYGCIKGKLVEINENLLNNNQLLVEKPLSEGFIAIILSPLRDLDDQLKNFTKIDDGGGDKNVLGVEVEELD